MHRRTESYKLELVRCTQQEYLDGRRRQNKWQIRRKKRMKRGVLVCLLSLFLGGCSIQYIAPNLRAHAARTQAVSQAAIPPEGGILKEAGAKVEAESTTVVNDLIAAGLEQDFPGVIPAERERGDILVAIDPGHGGNDGGCSYGQTLEKDINLSIAQAVERRLTELGYRVMLTREGDEFLSPEERAYLVNRAEADICVSIHQNFYEGKESGVSGIETWYNEEKGGRDSSRLAKLIHTKLIVSSEARDRGVVSDNSLYLIREARMPSCLVETGFLSDGEEREKLLAEEYQEKLADAIAAGVDLYFFPKIMYLTFDDGPSAENTDAVLDILKKYDIKATFFLIGESVEKYPEVAKRIVAEGHTIGIHCYSHKYEKIYASVDSYVEDFEKAKQVVYETTGVEAKLFRFPGGSINAYNRKVYKDIIAGMTERGYIYFDWNASLEDASKNNDPATLLQNAKSSTLNRKRVVMLAHDRIYNTTQCLEELIGQFPEYRMLPLTEDVEPVQF